MNAFESVRKFESAVAEYSSSKYAVAVDSCTNAIFLSCLYTNIKNKEVIIPCRTYPSVPCSIIHAGGIVKFRDYKWQGLYQLEPFSIIDGAKRFKKNMYVKGTLHCLSFHIKKHIPIGRGGMILTDDYDAYKWLKKSRYDGRDEKPLIEDNFTMLGWNFYMTPEQASRGLLMMMNINDDNPDLEEIPDYPDLSKFEIYKEKV